MGFNPNIAHEFVHISEFNAERKLRIKAEQRFDEISADFDALVASSAYDGELIERLQAECHALAAQVAALTAERDGLQATLALAGAVLTGNVSPAKIDAEPDSVLSWACQARSMLDDASQNITALVGENYALRQRRHAVVDAAVDFYTHAEWAYENTGTYCAGCGAIRHHDLCEHADDCVSVALARVLAEAEVSDAKD